MTIGEWERYTQNTGNCVWGGIICPNLFDYTDSLAFFGYDFTLQPGQVAGTGNIGNSGGKNVIDLDFVQHNLQDESTHNLLVEKKIELVNTELDAGLVKEIYAASGKLYDGTPWKIKEGIYDVKIEEYPNGEIPDASTMKINVKVTFGSDYCDLSFTVY